MVKFLAVCLGVTLYIIGTPWLSVHGLESSWGYRGFKVRCTQGVRVTGHSLGAFSRVRSKSECLKRCFAHLECESVSYSAKTRDCFLESSTQEAAGGTEDEDYVYCGPDTNEVWEVRAFGKLIPLPRKLKWFTLIVKFFTFILRRLKLNIRSKV